MDKDLIREKIDSFLEEKIAPLDKNIKICIYAGAVILPVALFVYFSFLPSLKEMDQLNKKQAALEQKISEAEAAAADLGKHKADMVKTELLLKKASVLLPQKKDIPSLLTNISQLGTDSGLDFLTFSPMGGAAKEFYKEVPVSISVRGPYHSIGSFLYQVSKLPRIVSAFNVSMAGAQSEHGEIILSCNMRLVTYRFVEAKK